MKPPGGSDEDLFAEAERSARRDDDVFVKCDLDQICSVANGGSWGKARGFRLRVQTGGIAARCRDQGPDRVEDVGTLVDGWLGAARGLRAIGTILRIEPARRVGSIVLDEGAAIRRRRIYVESAPRPALWLCRDRMNREGMPSKAAERAAGSDWQGPRIGGFKAFLAHRREMGTSAMAPCGRGRNQQP